MEKKKLIYAYNNILLIYTHNLHLSKCPGGVKVKILVCSLDVNKFELESYFHFHFWTNNLRKGINIFILPAAGCIVSMLFSYKVGFKWLTKIDIPVNRENETSIQLALT